MGTTVEKLNAILNTKENMKQKFNEKGVTVDDSVPFSEYPNKMDELSSMSTFQIRASDVKLGKMISSSEIINPLYIVCDINVSNCSVTLD